jgi:hypothetical protein
VHPRPRSVMVTDPSWVVRAVTDRSTVGVKRTRPGTPVAVTSAGRTLRRVTVRFPRTWLVTVQSPAWLVLT